MSVAAPSDRPPALVTAARLVTFAIICGVLYWGQVLLIPIALAALITFLMGPLVTRLDRWRVPRLLGVLIVVGVVTATLGGLAYIVVGQLGNLAEELPEHRQNVRDKVADLRAFLRGGALEKVQTTIDDISEDVGAAAESAEPATRSPDAGASADADTAADESREPVRVEIAPERQLLGDSEAWSPVLEMIATAGLTMLLSIFMLIRREDLRNRLVSLAGEASVVVTTKAFADAGQRISRYLLMQFVINASMGLAVGLGLFLIGVPYAALWGLSAAVFRYVPYVGPWAAALLPISVSLITAPGWEEVVLVIALFVTLELISNNVMEPWLYGQSVGLSAIAVIVSAIFWTWIWGPIGLVLATPLTVCLVVLSRHVPELAIFDRLLSDRPARQAHLWLYQRLLSRDEDEAEDIIERHTAEHSLDETCESLLFGTLVALKRDVGAGRITRDEGDFVASSLREIIDDRAGSEAASDESQRLEAGDPVLLIGYPVRDNLDELALHLLRVLLRDEHCELRILSPETLIGERIAEIERCKPAAVCVTALSPGELTSARHVCKRLRARLPGVKLIVGRLGATQATSRSIELLRAAGAHEVISTLEELHQTLQRLVREARPRAERAADAPKSELRSSSAR